MHKGAIKTRWFLSGDWATWLVISVWSAVAGPALASPVVPEPLQPWVPWVQANQPDLVCTASEGSKACVWPGQLRLSITNKGGTFALEVWLDRESWVRLPGGPGAWPQDVRLGDAPLAVTGEAAPLARLPAGNHLIQGQFAFDEPPQSLAIAPETGAIALTLQGVAVEQPARDAPDRLLLQQASQSPAELDTQSAVVLRRWLDGVPLQLTTRLVLRVGGRPRELVLGNVLPAGARPVALRTPLPAQLGRDGILRVHARPGEHVLELDALLLDGKGPLQVPELQGTLWDPVETWVWQPQEAVRGVELAGLTAVDADQTQIPPEWKGGRTFLVQRGEALTLRELRRGEAEPPPNQLSLERTWWLDLDGSALTMQDRFTGTLHRDWRLNAHASYALGRVATGSGGDDAVLITQHDGQRGVELRAAKVDVVAEGIWPQRTGPIAAVGWQTDVQSLRVDLRLPPGWRLWTASGVDELPQTWLGSWNLLDFFLVLMLALACGRLLGWPWAIVAGLGLALCHGEQDAPELLWLLLAATTGLLAYLPDGKLRRMTSWAHVAFLLFFVSAWMPFATGQIRGGLYPQTARDSGGFSLARAAATAAMEKVAAPAEEAPAAPPASDMDSMAASGEAAAYQQKKQEVLGKKADLLSRRQVQRVDPAAQVQTGPGLPSWQWQSLQLGWSGPVTQGQEVELYLLSPAANLLLAVLRVLLTAALALRLADLASLRRRLQALTTGHRTPGGGVAALVLCTSLAGAGLLAPQPVQAQLPDSELLGELQKRLVAADACEGPCASVERLVLRAEGRTLHVQLRAAAQRPAAVVLPGLADQLLVQSLQVDGAPSAAVRRTEAGQLAVRIPAGVHVVDATLRLPGRPVVDLPLAADARPKLVRFDSADWRLDGVDRSGVPSGALQLSRVVAEPAADPTAVSADAADAELPPWFSVERRLELALPWRVITTVRRTRASRPELLQLPLLAQEALLTADVRVSDAAGQRTAEVQFARDQLEVTLESELPTPPTATTLQLRAPTGVPFTERWVVDCAPLWHCSWQGLDPLHQTDPASALLLPAWLPWPGEALTLTVVRPQGAAGQTVTIAEAELRLRPGERLLQAELTLQIRASQGGWRTLRLPAGAVLQEVQLGGAPRVVRLQDGALQLPLQPGMQEAVVRWQQPWQFALWQSAPQVDLGGSAANVRVTFEVPDSRWLLWAQGPAWGPAILFWSQLVLALLLALGLALAGVRPLLPRQWLWLSLGLLQLPVPMSLLVIGWFAVLAWRGDHGTQPLWRPWKHNLLQLVLVGWTLAFLGTLYAALHTNLVFGVDMQVSGGGSSNQALQWYVDRVSQQTPVAGYLSVPMWVWRGLMLAWALWLVQRLLRWLPWGLQAWLSGAAWLPLRQAAPAAAKPAEPPVAAPE